ncbi:MAG: QueT transporter family protein [Clostridia bacterium]|nr:QueT transporter family protein [Clostridia bacterium]
MRKVGKKTRFITQAAMIAAIYAMLTYACALFSQGIFQFRIGEAMMVLPFFTPAAIPGLFVGYLIGYFLLGSLWDAIFGSLGALVAAFLTWLIGRYLGKYRVARFLASIPPIVMTAIVMPPILMYVYGSQEVYWLILAMVIGGESLTCIGLGQLFFQLVRRYERHLLL